MEPQARLQRIFDAIAEKNWNDAFYAMDDLFNSFSRGAGRTRCVPASDAPKVPPATYISIGDGGKDCYSLLSQPDGTAVFIRARFSKDTGMFEEDHKYILPVV